MMLCALEFICVESVLGVLVFEVVQFVLHAGNESLELFYFGDVLDFTCCLIMSDRRVD